MFEDGSWIPGTGTFINVITVAVGGLLGVAIGDRLPERMRRTILQGLGLVTIAVAVTGMSPLFEPDEALRRFVILIVAMIGGGLIGEALKLEERLEGAGERLRTRFVKDSDRETHANFIEGFVVASTVFCVGPLTIVGAVEDGLGISIKLLAIKSALDGFAAIGFASVYGWGVLASLITLVVYQGGLTAAAALVEPLMTKEVLAVLGAVGSLLVLGIGLRLLDIARVRVVALLPALFVGPAIAGILEALS
jgi:uncharacterized protein